MEKTPTACIRRRLWIELRMTRDFKEQARSTALALIGQYAGDAEVMLSCMQLSMPTTAMWRR
jgi:hypothetical protein